jgi:lipopolysaccharide transport system ATP-binding protein
MSDSELLIKVNGVSKKFCRSLKKSLWYGVQDICSDLNPFGKNGVGRAQLEDRVSEETGSPSPISHLPSPISSGLRPDEFWAVNNVSFELRRGECLGLIGRNGAAKTTLLKMLNGLIKPDSGSIAVRGSVGALIALGAGFNPILTGRENVYVNASILGLSKREIDTQMDGIIEFADIREFIDAPVQSYSSGMRVRLGFAIATAIKPDILRCWLWGTPAFGPSATVVWLRFRKTPRSSLSPTVWITSLRFAIGCSILREALAECTNR